MAATVPATRASVPSTRRLVLPAAVSSTSHTIRSARTRAAGRSSPRNTWLQRVALLVTGTP